MTDRDSSLAMAKIRLEFVLNACFMKSIKQRVSDSVPYFYSCALVADKEGSLG